MLFKDFGGFWERSLIDLDGLVLSCEADSEGEIEGDLVLLRGGGDRARCVGDGGTS